MPEQTASINGEMFRVLEVVRDPAVEWWMPQLVVASNHISGTVTRFVAAPDEDTLNWRAAMFSQIWLEHDPAAFCEWIGFSTVGFLLRNGISVADLLRRQEDLGRRVWSGKMFQLGVPPLHRVEYTDAETRKRLGFQPQVAVMTDFGKCVPWEETYEQ